MNTSNITPIQTTFSIEEIKNYLLSKDSMGDILYYLSAENIIKANQPEEEDEEDIDFGDLDILDWPE